jgi:hypothetical protein
VQTFLPYPDFARSAAVLDDPRLGKQRVETLQILRALVLDDYGWANHPATVMWRGRVPALVAYGLACVREWVGRGHADSTADLIAEFAPQVVGLEQDDLAGAGLLPSWLGERAVHASHRAALLRKDPAFYAGRVDGEDPDLPYAWPAPDADRPAAPDGRRLHVVRPTGVGVLGRFLHDGVVGLGASAGLEGDLSGARGEDLPALLRAQAPGRRAGKALRQLAVLLDDLDEGSVVAVPVEDERALLLGTVRGGYTRSPDGTHPVHRRPVTWDGGRVPRAALRPLGVLQDPRELFAVTVDG